MTGEAIDILKLKRCPVCGYDLSGLPAAHVCPECGFNYEKQLFELKMHRKPLRIGSKLVVFGIAFFFASLFIGLLLSKIDAAIVIIAGVFMFCAPLVDQYIRRRQSFTVLFTDDGVFHNQGRTAWTDMLSYADIEAFHFERDKVRSWRLGVIRRRSELSNATWVDGFANMDDDAAAAFEKDIRSRISSARERAA